VPGFAQWLAAERQNRQSRVLDTGDRERLARLDDPAWPEGEDEAIELKPLLTHLCAHYLVREKRGLRARDPVARFHLGNGARLERINWMGDPSPKGLRESHGILVNYGYDPAHIERNHETYATSGEVVHSSAVRKQLPPLPDGRTERPALAPPTEA
jgi:malonyl-CoA decarboxylase